MPSLKLLFAVKDYLFSSENNDWQILMIYQAAFVTRPFYGNVNHLAKILNTRDCKKSFFLLSRNLDEFKVDEF